MIQRIAPQAAAYCNDVHVSGHALAIATSMPHVRSMSARRSSSSLLRTFGYTARPARDIGFEQLAQLERGLLRRLHDLCLVVMYSILSLELRLIVLLEDVHCALRGRDAEPQAQ